MHFFSNMCLTEKLIVAALVVGIIGTGFAVHEEGEQWREFSNTHNCKKVAHRDGQISTGYGFSSAGNSGFIVTSTDDQTAYLCDDGVTYWR